MASKQIIGKIIAALWLRYPQTNGTDEQTRALIIGAWIEDLGDDCITDDALYAAYVEYKNSPEKWMPAPGVLRTRALELAQGNVKDLAEIAWQGVIDSEHGRQPQYMVDNLSFEIVRRIGGFDAMGNADSQEVAIWWNKKFVEMYAELKQREISSVPMLNGGAQKLLKGVTSKLQTNKPPINYEQRREQLLKQSEVMNAKR